MIRNFTYCITFLATLNACGGNKAAEIVTNDTIVEAPEPIVALPDTAYPSVSTLRVTTRVVDTVTDGTIDCYDDPYATAPGIMTFRGNQLRNADMHGSIKGTPSAIEVDWTFITETDNRSTGFGQWGGGSGWTGQPVYVEWHDGKKEIIVGSLSSNVYFIDYNTGKASREPIAVGNPIKGSVSLDPSLNGNLYVGQGVPAQEPFGAMVVDLNNNIVSDFFGFDPRAPRRWGAYDSSPVRVGRFLIRPGENGCIYKFIVERGKLRLHSTMSYVAPSGPPGIETSMSVYRNYGYTADNHGYVVCTNLDNMQPVWVYHNADDNDATPVLAIEDGKPYLYCSSEIDRQGVGDAHFAKLDALTGTPVWVTRFAGQRYDTDGKHFDGGFYASPLPGQGDCSHLIFSNVVYNNSGQNGKFVAINRADGSVVYETRLNVYAWSSPVGFVNDEGHMYVLTGDCGGNLYLIRGTDGTIVAKRSVGSNFESSPVVVGNTAVVGSRGNSIYKISIR